MNCERCGHQGRWHTLEVQLDDGSEIGAGFVLCAACYQHLAAHEPIDDIALFLATKKRYFWDGVHKTFDSIEDAIAWYGDNPPSSIHWAIYDEAWELIRTGGERVDDTTQPGDWLAWEQTTNGLVRLA